MCLVRDEYSVRFCDILITSHGEEENALSQFWQGSGPVTSYMYACSGSDILDIPIMIDI